MAKEKWLIGLIPFLLLFLEWTLGLSQQFTDPNLALCVLLAFWMVTWWVFEIMPLGITALIPLFYLPMSGLIPLSEVTASYANPVIYLFLGGFMIARGLEKTGLDRRLALNLLRLTGRSDRGILLGFVLATSGLSMWISNTATAVMMVPIAFSVTQFLKNNLDSSSGENSLARFQVVLFLSIAYAANIGGIMTPIGTPPNVVFVGYLNEIYGRSIDFSLWFVATAPLAFALLWIMMKLLAWVYPFDLSVPKSFMDFVSGQIQDLGPMNSGQKVTLFTFGFAAFLWIFKNLIHQILGAEILNDTSIAIMAGTLLFFIPTSLYRWQPTLDKNDIPLLPWDIILLFGGGMALANSLQQVGLIQKTTDLFSQMSFSHPVFLIASVATVALFMTEIMSNVAFCVVAIPMIMKLGEAQGLDPIMIALPATLCSSFAFSMPISTPPNAVVFGTNTLTVGQMLKAGILLNIVAVLLTASLGLALIQYILI